MDINSDNLFHLNRFKNYAPHSSYIAGFIDGDGCLFIRKIKDGFQSGINIAQARTNILQVIKYHYGGNITSSTNRSSKVDDDKNEYGDFHKHNKRNQYSLNIRSNECKLLLESIQQSIIIKQNQTDALCGFLKLVNKSGHDVQKNEFYNLCSLKKEIYSYKFDRLNIEYVQGLFDAEGCFYMDRVNYSKYKISLTQKSHPAILYEIQKFLGFGIVNTENKYVIYKRDHCLQFILLIKDGLIVKYNQAIAFETFLKTDDISIKENMYKVCNEEKHKTEVFKDLDKNNDGKDMFFETIKFKEIKEKICKEINLIGIYKEKSLKMSGSKNHNYGKKFTEETRKKMSNSIRESKGGVTDEIILEVRKLIEEGLLNVHIQEKLNLSRHTVTRIKNQTIVCRNEEKINKPDKPQEHVNVCKRKIFLDEILIVIEKCTEGKRPGEILEYLIKLREQKNIENTLTVDIVKNIKRSIMNKKLPFYSFEMSPEKYNHYKTMIETFIKV